MTLSLRLMAPPCLAALALTGCATLPTSPLPPGAEKNAWMAMGNEPGWMLELTPGQMNYTGDYGETIIRVPVIRTDPVKGGVIYSGAAKGQTLKARIQFTACADTMADRTFAQRVTVEANGRTVQGCGGALLPPVKLDGSRWRITRINTNMIPESVDATISFTADRASIHAGCNRINASYTAAQHRITFSSVITTLMGCPALLDQYESDLASIFKQPLHMRYTAKGGITLLGRRNEVVELTRIH